MKEALHIISKNESAFLAEPNPTVAFFNVAELHDKLMVNFSDILLVTADEYGGRNKLIWLKGEVKEYTLMNVSFPSLLKYSDKLVMVNKFAAISFEAIHYCSHDFITLKNIFPGWNNKQVVLSRKYRKDFFLKGEI